MGTRVGIRAIRVILAAAMNSSQLGLAGECARCFEYGA